MTTDQQNTTQSSAGEGDQPKFYNPPQAMVENSNIMAYAREKGFSSVDELYGWTIANPQEFWVEMANRFLDWYQPWDQVLDDSNKPFYKWFTGAKTNVYHNAIERHLDGPNRDKVAIIWESEQGETKTYTYAQLAAEINRFANALKGEGVQKGDRVTIYLSRVPELLIAMLAVVKIGAMHSVVYGGFSTEALHSRIEDAQSNVLITGDGGWMNNKIVELKKITDEAVDRASEIVKRVIVLKRTGHDIFMKEGRDVWWHELVAKPGMDDPCPTEQMDAEDPMFMLYTSGTTGTPKGLVHTCGGYQVYVATTLNFVFDLKPDDIWWCAADPGWITGHSYIVYAPLILGATEVIYEGAPSFPNPGRWWQVAEKYGVTVLYTAPTAIRGLMRFGDDWPNKYDLSKLRLLGSVGEPINPEAWRWYHRVIGRNNCPIDGHLVADRDRRLYDHAQPDHAAEARLGHQALPGHRGRRADRGGRAGQPGRRRAAGDQDALARHAAHDLRRPRPLRPAVLDAPARLLHGGRRGPQGRRRLLLGDRADRRCDQGLGLPPGHRRGRVGAGLAPGRGRGGGDRAAARAQGQRHLHLCDPAAGLRGERRAGRGAAPARGQGDGADRQARADHLCRRGCPRRARARSCGGCSRPAR